MHHISKRHDIRVLYTPVERALLAKYLERQDPEPQDLVGISVARPVDPDTWDEQAQGIGPVCSEIDCNDLMLENAVARICLEPIQLRLPQWACVSGEGVTLGRHVKPALRPRRRLRPRHLFTINWADSGPGFSWPEAYYATPLPGYDVCIVTASADSPDTHGYCDFAIGWHAGRPSDIERAGGCIREWWLSQAVIGQERWAYLFDSAAVDSQTANAWASTVWADENVEEEDDDDGE